MCTRFKVFGFFAMVILICLQMAGTVSALETPAPIKIAALVVSYAENMHFRVVSNNPSAWLCYNGPTNGSWAYVNESDSGAKVKIATLMTAYTLGKSVSLNTEGVNWGGITYCHIVEFSIND